MMTDRELALIGEHVDLFVTYGDRAALTRDDVAALWAEIVWLRGNQDHLILMTRQHLAQISELSDQAERIRQKIAGAQ